MILIAISCSKGNPNPRIAIIGIGVECSTFSPAKTTLADFRTARGEEIYKSYPCMDADSSMRSSATWVPTLTAWATPGGIVTREAYEALVTESLDLLKKGAPYDGVFFDIHGAMSVEGMDDPEGDYIQRVREVIGKDVLISTCMDLHGNVSQRLANDCDLITCYRLAPHEDSQISKRRAMANLVNRLKSGEGRPKYKAWVAVPVLLPGEKTSTRVEPGKSLYAKIDPLVANPEVLDASIWIAYAWADEPRNHAVVMATGDDKEAVGAAAEELAKSFWDVREEFEFVAPTASLEECLENALKSDKKPYMISDMGDNPTAGGAGDVTWTLEKLLARPEFKSEKGKKLIYAAIPGADLVAKAKEAKIGNIVEGFAGAEVDNRYAPPVKLKGEVMAIRERGDNDQVVIKVGSIYVIVGEKRSPYHFEKDFDALNLNPREADIIVVKLGYLTKSLYDMRGDWMMAQTRGGVDQDLVKLPYKRIIRPMFPFDPDMDEPDLKAQFL